MRSRWMLVLIGVFAIAGATVWRCRGADAVLQRLELGRLELVIALVAYASAPIAAAEPSPTCACTNPLDTRRSFGRRGRTQ